MGLYSRGLIIGMLFEPEIWRAYFREGLFLGGLIIGILRYLTPQFFKCLMVGMFLCPAGLYRYGVG